MVKENKESNNPRKNKVLLNIWLTKEEEREIFDILNERFLVEKDTQILTQRLKEIKSRGDLFKR